MFTTAWCLMFLYILGRVRLSGLIICATLDSLPLFSLVKNSATWGWTPVVWDLKVIKIWGFFKNLNFLFHIGV